MQGLLARLDTFLHFAYWDKLQDVAHRRNAFAGYRIADIVLFSADRIFADRALAGKVLDAMQRHGSAAK